MIVAVTPSPSLDRTATCASSFDSSGVRHLSNITIAPGGGGMNVAHVLYLAGNETEAVVPAPSISHYMRVAQTLGIPTFPVEVPGPVPLHFHIAFKDGQQVEYCDPAMPLDTAQLAMLREQIVAHAEHAEWVVLAGELPEAANTAWFVDVMRAIHLYHPTTKIAISTAGSALKAVLRQVYTIRPDLVVIDSSHVDADTTPDEVVSTLLDAELTHILFCHNDSHFTLHSKRRSWQARYTGEPRTSRLPWIDSALAGLLLGDLDDDPERALVLALAYANGSGHCENDFVPTPDTVRLDLVQIN